MRASGDAVVVVLVLGSIGLALAAPLFGRAGHPVLADSVMALGAASLCAGFAWIARETVRAARRAGSLRRGDEE